MMSDEKMKDETADLEVRRCVEALDYVLRYHGREKVSELLNTLYDHVHNQGVSVALPINSPYVNTIPVGEEPSYPGDLEIEQRIRSYIRWNAMAMVVKANRDDEGLGGHISTYASSATILETGFNHFFHGNGEGHSADQIFFQGHASPGNYARAFLEGRLTEEQLHSFRRELAPSGGLSSYPHPYLMPTFWQFPTVSMGLGPLLAIYQARFNRYLKSRGLVSWDREPRVYCMVGDGEVDEPETLGALAIGARENLDNLTFIVNCNLQRLDGPVRGNGKIIQELEGVFRGAGWNVIKVVWGSDWDPLLSSEHSELLIKRMGEVVDGEFQKYVVEPGSYIRKHFFGKYPELLELVNHMTDRQIQKLLRGGHDPKKMFAAFQAACDHKGRPTVILAKTVKGYGLGEAGEGKNVSHNQKKLNEKELREFRARFGVPISDEDIADAPFFRPELDTPEMQYLFERRQKLGGFLPERKVDAPKLEIPDLSYFQEFFVGSGESALSTTMAYVRILTKLLRHPDLGPRIVPIIPDEARTFGMESLFRQIGIYSTKGQLYEPVDRESLLYYREATDGQVLEEGINEAGAMSSFVVAGTSYATHGVPMIPLYIYYSMFGFQRIGDLAWLAGDIRAKGFLIGGTAGRTTLNGEGLQHQDGHSHLLAAAIPNLLTYDIAFRYEIAVIMQDGLKRMYQDQEEIYYYLSVGNENYVMPEMPKNAEQGILQGLYKFSAGIKSKKPKVHLFGSGSIMNCVIEAQKILETDYGYSVDVWGATNYKRLRSDAMNARRWNMLHPDKPRKVSYLEAVLSHEEGHFVAASDNVRLIPDQIAPWVSGGLFTLGTDGFGRSETRSQLRRYFEVDAACIVVGTLYMLSEKGLLETSVVKKAIRDLKVDPEKVYPVF